MPKLSFKSFEDGISFFMLSKQFLRVAGKIEACHDKMLSQDCNEDKAKETLKYYQEEKSILLGLMNNVLNRAQKVW